MIKTNGLLANYRPSPDTLDEAYSDFPSAYAKYPEIVKMFDSLPLSEFKRLNEIAKLSFLNQGITYAVYSEEGGGTEKIFPFDLFPRIIDAEEWSGLEQGLEQRNLALNKFLKDVYAKGQILKDKVVPEELVKSSAHYVEQMEGFLPAGGIYTHICGTDLIRHTDGNFYVLEDNLRSPSGVSYVLSNRETMRRTFHEVFRDVSVEIVNNYPRMLLDTLWSVAPERDDPPRCVVLTPGQYNSAYYEHSLLARLMGIDLVEGKDLYVEDDIVYLKTIHGPKRVDVIYRRIDDAFLDPKVFRRDSQLGVAGLLSAYRKGSVTITNAPGTGIADDKAICAYVPDMIRYYLKQEPIISNVPTYICARKKDLQYVLENLSQLVVKPVDMSGGYGVTICDQLSKAELAEMAQKIKKDPREFIAQPKMMLSVHSTFIEQEGVFAPRHIDLRTFTLLGADKTRILKGGLTRVALKAGSLIVNSSQGGGSKDTWVTTDT